MSILRSFNHVLLRRLKRRQGRRRPRRRNEPRFTRGEVMPNPAQERAGEAYLKRKKPPFLGYYYLKKGGCAGKGAQGAEFLRFL
jgi:hypothetical protein